MENHFGIILRSKRESRMMSQKQLAEEVGIVPSHLNKIEKGINMPSDKVLFNLADVLVAEELFAAAGRLIPLEFLEKYPPVEPPDNLDKLVNLPDILNKLKNSYRSGFHSTSEKYYKLKEDIRFVESFIDRDPEIILRKIEEIQNHPLIKGNSKELDKLITSLQLSAKNYLKYIFEITKNLWSLTDLDNEMGNYYGREDGLYDTWKEIKIIAKSDLSKFLIDVLEIDEDDSVAAEIISDIIKSRKEKKSKKKPSSE